MKCPKCKSDNPDTLKFCGECATSLMSLKDISVTKAMETPAEGMDSGTMIAGRYEVKNLTQQVAL